MALPSSGSSASASSVPKLCSICAMSLTVTAKPSMACRGGGEKASPGVGERNGAALTVAKAPAGSLAAYGSQHDPVAVTVVQSAAEL